MPSESVVLPWIAEDRRVWFAGKRRFDLCLRSLRNEFVFLGQVHQQRRLKAVDLAQIFLSVTTVIGDRSVNTVASGRQEGHQSAEAIAQHSNLTSTARQLGHVVDGIVDVPRAGVSVIGLIETKAVLPIGLGGDTEVDSRLLTPK